LNRRSGCPLARRMVEVSGRRSMTGLGKLGYI
jgi:hypothetical protein